jgi:hypothetical protein
MGCSQGASPLALGTVALAALGLALLARRRLDRPS